MVAVLSGLVSECVGCMEVVASSGLGELAMGLVVTAVVLAPATALHLFLRRRGR